VTEYISAPILPRLREGMATRVFDCHDKQCGSGQGDCSQEFLEKRQEKLGAELRPVGGLCGWRCSRPPLAVVRTLDWCLSINLSAGGARRAKLAAYPVAYLIVRALFRLNLRTYVLEYWGIYSVEKSGN
jgi:hypothetical protein